MWAVLSPPPPHSTSRQLHPTSKSRNTSTTLPKTGSRLLRPAIPKWWMASSHCRMDQVSPSHWTKRSFASIHDSRYFSICSPKTGTVARRNAQQPRSSRRKKIETRVNLSPVSTQMKMLPGEREEPVGSSRSPAFSSQIPTPLLLTQEARCHQPFIGGLGLIPAPPHLVPLAMVFVLRCS